MPWRDLDFMLVKPLSENCEMDVAEPSNLLRRHALLYELFFCLGYLYWAGILQDILEFLLHFFRVFSHMQLLD